MLSVWLDDKLLTVIVWSHMTQYDIEASIVSSSPLWRNHLDEILSYPFIQLGLDRVTAKIREDNKRSIKACEAVGFTHEGTIRKGHAGINILIYGMLKEEWPGYQKY